MKRILIIFLASLLSISCGKDDDKRSNNQPQPPEKPKEVMKIATISSYSKNYGYSGDVVEISGEGFPKKEECKITFGNTEAKIESVSEDGKIIRIVLPRSSEYLPQLKFDFGKNYNIKNEVDNPYEQKIGIIEKEVGKWIKTKWAKTTKTGYSMPDMRVYVVGERMYAVTTFPSTGILLTTLFSEDKGITWKKWATSSYIIGEIHITSKNEGLNSDGGYVYKVPYKGASNKQSPIFLEYGEMLFDAKGEIVGLYCDDDMKNIIIVDYWGNVYKSIDGKNFIEVRTDTERSKDYQGSSFKRGFNHIWIAGGVNGRDYELRAKILFCNGNNEQWTEYKFVDEPWSFACAVHFPSDQLGYCVVGRYPRGDGNGKLFKTTNGGHSWVELSTVPIKSKRGYLAFADEQTGWISSDKTVYKTTDGGISWKKVLEAETHIERLIYTDEALYAFAQEGNLYRYYFK